MIDRFVRYLLSLGVIAPEDTEVQLFAMTAIAETLASHGVLLVLALIFGVLPETILFELIFMPLRSYAGGFHAPSTGACFALSTAVWGAIMYLGQVLPGAASLPILAGAGAVIWHLAPVPHKNNPVGPRRLARVKTLARRFLLADAAAVLLCFFFWKQSYAVTGALTLLATACSLLAAKREG